MIRIWTGAAAAVAMGLAAGQALAQSEEIARGQRVFNQQCRACHTLEKGGASVAGPNLYGIFGSKAGTVAGYTASEAMVRSGLEWDEKTIAEYCRDPKGKVPGTKMAFNGIKQPAQLADLVAFLKEATK